MEKRRLPNGRYGLGNEKQRKKIIYVLLLISVYIVLLAYIVYNLNVRERPPVLV